MSELINSARISGFLPLPKEDANSRAEYLKSRMEGKKEAAARPPEVKVPQAEPQVVQTPSVAAPARVEPPITATYAHIPPPAGAAAEPVESFMSIKDFPSMKKRLQALRALLRNESFISADGLLAMANQVMTITMISECLMNPSLGYPFFNCTETIAVCEKLVDCGILDILVPILKLRLPKGQVDLDRTWPAVKYHILTIIACLAGWNQPVIHIEDEITVINSKRYSSIVKRMLSQELVEAILDSSTTCPMALIRACHALHAIIDLMPAKAHLIIDANALSWFSLIGTPGFLETLINSLPSIPEYLIPLACEGVEKILPQVPPNSIEDEHARKRILARIPTCWDHATNLLLRVGEYNDEYCEPMMVERTFQRCLRHWTHSPLLNFDDDLSVFINVYDFLEVCCSNPNIVNLMADSFDLYGILQRGLYLPVSCPPETCLYALESVFSLDLHYVEVASGQLSLVEVIFIHFLSDSQLCADMAGACIMHFSELPTWPQIFNHICNAGILTETHLYALKMQRPNGGAPDIPFLLEQYALLRKLSEPSALVPEHPPSVHRERGNKFYREKNYEAAVEAYSAALSSALMHDDTEEILKAYGNRAQCHLQLNNSRGAIRDASAAVYLENLDPSFDSEPTEAKLTMLAKNLQRRASAFMKLNEPLYAANDLSRVVAITPTSEATALRQAALAACEERYEWKITCSACTKPFRWLKKCGCRGVAYCSVGCEQSHLAKHKAISPDCGTIGRVYGHSL